MLFSEFLDLVKVMKMLYGREIAEKFFTKNVTSFYNLDSESLNQVKKTETDTQSS